MNSKEIVLYSVVSSFLSLTPLLHAADVQGDRAKIGDDNGNSHTLSGTGSTISGGGTNTCIADYATVAGGLINTNAGGFSVVGGGYANTVRGNLSGIVGGAGNTVNSDHSFIGGGTYNTIDGGSDYVTIGGGSGNYSDINITNATIAGGWGNVVSGNFGPTIGGGFNNTAYGWLSTIGGGGNHVIGSAGTYGTISGGNANLGYGYAVTIAGGTSNNVYEALGTIGGGDSNTVDAGATSATISGGIQNYAAAPYSTISGGTQAATRSYGQAAYSSGKFTDVGDAETSVYVLRGLTTTSNLTELFLDGVAERMKLATNQTWEYQIQIAARSTNGNSAVYQMIGGIKNVAGTTTLLTNIIQLQREDVIAWTPLVAADNAHSALSIKVVGDSTPVRWVATVKTTEVLAP